MQEEYFDILDENGNQTNLIKKRTEVHRDGDWHKAVHIWIINENGDILLQRRASNKDIYPNMLDISCAGHLTTGDDSITGALRELKEELNLEIEPEELNYITTLKRSPKDKEFIDNEFDDLYLLRTTKKIEELTYQKEEISEIFFVPYKEFKKMIDNKQSDLVIYSDVYQILFNLLDDEFDNE